MSFRFPVKLFFEDFREKVIEEKANQERIKIEKINQDDVYDFISNFLNEDDTRNKLPNYLSKIKDVSNERIKRALGKRSDGSVPLVYMDLVTIYFTKNFNTSFLIHFNIDTTTKLRKFVQKNEIQNFQEIKINSDILNMYDKESLKILPNTIIDKVNAIEIDHSVEEITNKWRFWFPNGSSNVYSQKILHELSNRLNLNKGSKLENHTDCFCEKLDDFILDCIIDEEKLKDKKLQEHIEQKLLFPDELSVLQLFNLGKIKNVDPRKNRGIDLLSLDVLACFIAGKPTTLQKYLGLEKASDLEQFLTEHHKTDSNEFKKRNLEGRNFDKICEEGFWYKDIEAVEKLKAIIEEHKKNAEKNVSEESQDLSSQSHDFLASSRTGEAITNKWRFWFENKSGNKYSRKVWQGLKQRLELSNSDKVIKHVSTIYKALDKFILDCRIDEKKIDNKELQKHINQKLLFPDESSVLQLFNLGEIKNGGNDLLSLDVLACFIAGKPTTLQKYLDLEKASDLEQFLTEYHKTDSNEFKKRNLEGRNFDKICEEGFWYEDRRAIENLKSKKGDIKKSKWVIYIPIPILIFIITSILCWNNLSLAERKEGLDMSIVILPFDKSNDSNLTMEKFIKNELNKFYNNSLNPTGATLEITIEKSVNLSKYDYSLECDPGIIQKIGKDLNADIVIWGDYAYIENKGEYSSKVYSLIIDGIDSQIPKKVSNIISMLNKKQLESLRERKSPPISIHNRDKNQVQDLHIVVECIIAFQYLKEGNWKKAFDVFKKKYYLEAYMFIMKEILKKSTSALEYADKYYSDKGDGKYHTYVCLMLGESYFYHSSTKENAIDEVKIKNKLFLDKSKFYLEIFFRLSKQRRISLEMSNKLDEKYQEALRMENEALLNYIKNMYVQGVSTEGIIKVINNHILELKRIQELRIDTNLYEYLDSYINIILPEEKAHFYTLKGAFNRAMNEIFDILDYCGVNYENLIFNAFLQKEFDLKQINYSNIRTILEECESFNEGIFNRENSEYISIGKILILIGFIHEIRFDELEYLNIKYYDIKPSKDLKREKVQVLTLYFIEYVRSSYHVKENLKLFEKIEIKRINKLKTISVNQYLTDSHNKLHNERILSIQKME